MSHLKFRVLGIIAMLAVVAISGVAASAASAAFTLSPTACSGGTFKVLCWSTTATSELKELEGEETLEGTSLGTVLLKATVGGLSVEIECKKAELELEESTVKQPHPLSENAKYDIKIFFLECGLLGTLKEKCTIPSEKLTELLEGTPLSSTVIDFTGPGGSAATFIGIPFSGTACPLKGEKLVTGTQEVKLSSAEPATEHELVATEKSELLFAENAATLKLVIDVKLDNISPDFWDSVENG